MAIRLAPGLYIETPISAPGPIAAVPMDIAAFVGIAERGPTDKAVVVDGWRGFVDRFGTFLPNAFLAYSVRAFFENGGRRAHVVRIAAPEVTTSSDPAAAQPADRMSSIVLSANGFAAGALVSIRQRAATLSAGAQPADRMSSVLADIRGFSIGDFVAISEAGGAVGFCRAVAVDAAGKRVTWQTPLDAALDLTQPISFTVGRAERRILADIAGATLSWRSALDPRFDLTLPITFAAGAAAGSGILPDESGRPALEVSAASAGTWSDAVAVRVVRMVAANTNSVPRGTPDAAGSLTVTNALAIPAGATVELGQPGVAGTVRRLVTATDPATRRYTFDAPLPGPYSLADAASGARPITVAHLAFGLSVFVNGRLTEVFSNLTMPAADESPLNISSQFIRISRIPSATAYPLPDPQAATLVDGALGLAGGRDGIAMLTPVDITGDPTEPVRRGIRVFEFIDEPASLLIPDIMLPPIPAVETTPLPKPVPDPCLLEPPSDPVAGPPPPEPIEGTPAFGLAGIARVHAAMVAHCEARTDRVAILDPPLFADRPDPLDPEAIIAWRQRFDTSYGAFYYPWIAVWDPIGGGPNPLRSIPPSGHVAGLWAQSELQFGVQKAPANIAALWAQSLTEDVGRELQAILNPLGINCFRRFDGRGLRLYGARTLSSNPNWRYVSVRRLMIQLRKSLARALAWSAFEPNGPRLQRTLLMAIASFLETMWERRALSGNDAAEAFYVRLNPGGDAAALAAEGKPVIEIGVAPVIPAEFVVLRIGRTEDGLAIAELPPEPGSG
jgi:phage tail sheath protein FI